MRIFLFVSIVFACTPSTTDDCSCSFNISSWNLGSATASCSNNVWHVSGDVTDASSIEVISCPVIVTGSLIFAGNVDFGFGGLVSTTGGISIQGLNLVFTFRLINVPDDYFPSFQLLIMNTSSSSSLSGGFSQLVVNDDTTCRKTSLTAYPTPTSFSGIFDVYEDNCTNISKSAIIASVVILVILLAVFSFLVVRRCRKKGRDQDQLEKDLEQIEASPGENKSVIDLPTFQSPSQESSSVF
jgi:hypothetical protein